MISSESALGANLQEMATMLRGAVNLQGGLVDINICFDICFDVAGRLEKMILGHDSAAPEVDALQEVSTTSIFMVRSALQLKNSGTAAVLLFLLINPNASHTNAVIAEKTGYRIKSVPVFASQLKNRLAEMGLADAIKTIWKAGYSISTADAARIRRLLPISLVSSLVVIESASAELILKVA